MSANTGTPFAQQTYKRGPSFEWLEYKNIGQLVSNAGLTDIALIPVSGVSRLYCTVKPSSGSFTAFQIQALVHKDSPTYITLYSSTTDYTSPKGTLLGTSGDLSLLTSGVTGWFILDVAGMETLRLMANSASVSGVVDIYAGGATL